MSKKQKFWLGSFLTLLAIWAGFGCNQLVAGTWMQTPMSFTWVCVGVVGYFLWWSNGPFWGDW